MKRKRRWAMLCATAALVGLMLHTGGCNTIEGAGKDIEALGSNTARAARDHNPYREEQKPADGNPYE